MKRLLPILLTLVLLVGAVSLSVSAASLADQTPGQAAKAMTFPTDGSNFFECLGKDSGGGLTGMGKDIRFHQLFIKLLVADGHSIHIHLVAEMHSQRHNGAALPYLRHEVAGRINNDACFHEMLLFTSRGCRPR